MTTSTDELRDRVRQLSFPTEEGAAGGPGGSMSGRGARPRPSLGLGDGGGAFNLGSPTPRRNTPASLNLGVGTTSPPHHLTTSPPHHHPLTHSKHIWLQSHPTIS